MRFLEWKYILINTLLNQAWLNLTDTCWYWVTIGFSNDLAPNRRQALP